jgi:quercetin dioxygenase-like cupin family protein
MKLVSLVLSILITAGALVPADKVLGQPGVSPVLVRENRFEGEPPPADAEIINLVLDFAPGVWLPLHVHSGPGYATVLEGTMRRRGEGTDRTFDVGEGWVDRADVPHHAGNDATVRARILATFVIPRGTTLTTILENDATAPGATTFAELRMDASDLPSPLDLVHRVVKLGAGLEVPAHSHEGITVVSVLNGNGNFEENGTSREVATGVSWADSANTADTETLVTSAPVELATTRLLPPGAALMDPVAVPVPARFPAPVQLPGTR